MRTVGLVSRREIRERGGTRGYLIGTAVTLLLMVAAVVVPTLLIGDGVDERALGVVGNAPADLDAQLATMLSEDVEVTVTELADRDAAVDALEEGEVDAALVEQRELLADGRPDERLRAALDAALQLEAVSAGLEDAGISAEQAAAALTPPPPLETVDIGDPDGDRGEGGFLVGIGMTILLFLGIQLNGATVLSGALEEKSSRVVEVLVSVARPWQLLAGKLLGMSALALGQIALLVAGGLGANAVVGAFELPPATGLLIATSLVMLVAGFLFYASLYAVAGSLASSLEDAQSSAGPLGFLMTGAYVAVFLVAVPDPGSVWSQILTFVPPTAPFVVPARLGLGELPAWQAVVSVIVTVLASFVTVRLAGRLYASSLLAGGKVTWRSAWRGEPIR
ncbi:ABC transporter permease [Nitriliruptor alkaliphilus]|uniref:ABC transporter permease n=1 Tax=Nitriliruptor alkaliphilus TaxID=427918 RepID=UPI001FE052E3|nr:ABC transporter permease [Nitriliruptor alkaliphilus]